MLQSDMTEKTTRPESPQFKLMITSEEPETLRQAIWKNINRRADMGKNQLLSAFLSGEGLSKPSAYGEILFDQTPKPSVNTDGYRYQNYYMGVSPSYSIQSGPYTTAMLDLSTSVIENSYFPQECIESLVEGLQQAGFGVTHLDLVNDGHYLEVITNTGHKIVVSLGHTDFDDAVEADVYSVEELQNFGNSPLSIYLGDRSEIGALSISDPEAFAKEIETIKTEFPRIVECIYQALGEPEPKVNLLFEVPAF